MGALKRERGWNLLTNYGVVLFLNMVIICYSLFSSDSFTKWGRAWLLHVSLVTVSIELML